MATDLQKLVKLYTKAEQATTRKKAKKVFLMILLRFLKTEKDLGKRD